MPMSSAAIAYLEDWDRPINRPTTGGSKQAHSTLETKRTVEEAIDAWLAWRPFARTTVNRVKGQLSSTRARGWRHANGIVTIDEFTAAAAAEYLRYLWDRGAAPATLRKIKNLLTALSEFCAETPGYEGLEGDEL